MKVAYIMSRFPNLTETFVLYEIVALERMGVSVEVHPLLRTRQEVVHEEARRLAGTAHYRPFLSVPILVSNLRSLLRRPRRYLGALVEALRGTFGSANFFVGALGIFPKSVAAAEAMRRSGVRHVHAHFANHPALAALIIHRLTDIPFSFTAHGHDVHVERRMLGHKIASSSFAVAISEHNRRLMIEECPGHPERVVLLHCGADTDRFVPVERAPRIGRVLTLITLGALIEVKGHRVLVEALRLLRERGIEIRAYFLGEGDQRSALEAQIEAAGLTQQVHLLGATDRAGVVDRMREADVVVQPSVPTARGSREGIPVSLMEGMAAGLPVVASRLSGIPELVVDDVTGILTPPGDTEALAGALERLHREPATRTSFGERGRERVLEHFNLERNAARLLRMFEEGTCRMSGEEVQPPRPREGARA